MAHDKFDEMVAYCRLPDEHFGPPAKLICPNCDNEMALTGINKDKTDGFLECTGCAECIMVAFRPNEAPSQPITPEDIQHIAENILPKGLIEWALEKGRLEAEIAFPRPGANVETLEMQFREWLKNNPQPGR